MIAGENGAETESDRPLGSAGSPRVGAESGPPPPEGGSGEVDNRSLRPGPGREGTDTVLGVDKSDSGIRGGGEHCCRMGR